MNKVRLNGISYLLPARWSDIMDRRQFVAICRALYEFESGRRSFDEFRLDITLAVLNLNPTRTRPTDTLYENLFRISELLDFPYKITENPDVSRTASINIRLEQNLLQEVGGVTGYRYRTDEAGVVDTDLTAAQYVEMLSILPLYSRYIREGKDIIPILNNAIDILYHGAADVSDDEKLAIFYNYRGIMATISADPDYEIIFHTEPGTSEPSPVGPQASIFALSKAGYGDIEKIRALDVYTYLAALVQQTIDSIRALASSGMKAGEIASKLRLSAELVAPYVTQ